ncbi:phosphatidylserine/phosphatidylglycerophosphate/cardiolipin synthase family protein [Parasphingorhabdus sp.]|uniref:phospholipase D-like domain-containing protein n=1 Tax=Parasphingorhabdus sp. TaxID=2709688 RepID=UPI00326542BB
MDAVISPTDHRPQWFTVGENRLKLVHQAGDRLDALIELIDHAEQSLQLYYYMVDDDAIGRLVLTKLIEACQRGVAVELMVDSFGSNGSPQSFFDPLIGAGVKFGVFSPRFSTSYLVRNHQKMTIADNRRAIIGGFNLTKNYFDQLKAEDSDKDHDADWEDIGIVIEGPETQTLTAWYEKLSDWVRNDNGNILALQRMVRKWDPGQGSFRWLLGGPSNRLSRWAWSIKKDIEAGSRLHLVSAYFSPGQGLLRRIARVSKLGGESQLLLPGKTDNAATIGASRLLYGYLLKRNASIFEYGAKRLHAKMVIIDDAVYVGSANFDIRSLFINVEMMVRIEDSAFAAHARQLVGGMIEEAEPITNDLHQSRKSLLNRIRWVLSYFLVNTLDYSVSRRFNFGLRKTDRIAEAKAPDQQS